MNQFIPNTNPNLTVVRQASDGIISLVPIIYWGELQLVRVPIDLTHMGIDWAQIMYLDFAIHDATTRQVYLRNGDVFDTLMDFVEAS